MSLSLDKIEALAPDLMATALTKQDIARWAASNDIALIRGKT